VGLIAFVSAIGPRFGGADGGVEGGGGAEGRDGAEAASGGIGGGAALGGAAAGAGGVLDGVCGVADARYSADANFPDDIKCGGLRSPSGEGVSGAERGG
jgi:hypothetical protein